MAALSWTTGLAVGAARDEVIAAISDTPGISMRSVDERTVVAGRRYLPVPALVAGLALIPFTAGVSLLLLLYRGEESLTAVLDVADGQTRIVLRGAVRPEVVERLSDRLGTLAVRS